MSSPASSTDRVSSENSLLICASISSKKLGYASTLCGVAAGDGPDQIDRIADLVSAHPEVTHNYLREAEYNVWFTAIAPSHAHLEQLVDEVRAETGREVLNLPVTALYKIRVDFGSHGRRQGGASHDAARARSHAGPAAGAPFDAADPFDVALIRWAQADVVAERPFREAAAFVAAQTGDPTVDELRVLDRLREWRESGVIRRFGAFVRHRKLGYAFNGMTVWNASDDRAAKLGASFAALTYVSHCYSRPPAPTWPYNLYAMVHAKSQDELDGYVAEMESISGLQARVLLSTKEYKKSLPVFFGGAPSGNQSGTTGT